MEMYWKIRREGGKDREKGILDQLMKEIREGTENRELKDIYTYRT